MIEALVIIWFLGALVFSLAIRRKLVKEKMPYNWTYALIAAIWFIWILVYFFFLIKDQFKRV